MHALWKRLRANGREGCLVQRRHAVYDDGSVALRRKDRYDENSRGSGQTRAPFPGIAVAWDARSGSSQVRLPALLIARLGDDADDSLDLALAADCGKAATARREMFSIRMALLVAGFAESDRAGQYLGRSAVCSNFHEFESSFITWRKVFIARQTRCRTASALVPRI